MTSPPPPVTVNPATCVCGHETDRHWLGIAYCVDCAKGLDAPCKKFERATLPDHRRVTDVWRPPGMGATYRAACSCGWISTTPPDRDGWPPNHDEDYARHAEGTVLAPRPEDPPVTAPAALPE